MCCINYFIYHLILTTTYRQRQRWKGGGWCCLIFQQISWDSVRLNHLPKVTQLTRSKHYAENLYTGAELNLRQSFGWSRKEELYCFARQRGPQLANALKTTCPNLGKTVRSFMVIVYKGSDQLMDILLMGWWWGKWESASSTSCSGVYMLVGSVPLL